MAQINKPSEYFDTKLYSGDGGTQTVTGLEFQPDWTWVKSRNTTDGHTLQDVVRGFGSDTKLASYSADEENDSGGATWGGYGYQSAATSDGFTMVAGTTPGQNNKTGNNYASWSWLAGGTPSSNTDGTITSSVSANTTSAFSIGTYDGTGADNTVGHGLGVAPDMIIVKCRSTAHDWICYHSALGSGKIITLNSSAAASNATGWQNTDPTSTVFSIDNAANSLNQSGQSFVFYAFAEKKGYSKFGSYIGNANANGPFIYTGFKPAFTIIKNSSGAFDWLAQDSTRQTNANFDGNPINILNQVNATNVESNASSRSIDFLSNGFKIRNTSGAWNTSGNTFIYMAFAENPLVGTNNIPATAR